MTPQETQQLKALLVATALYYEHALPDEVLKMYVEDLVDLPYARVAIALKEVRRDPKIFRCPKPADIRARIEPPDTAEAQAVVVANRIIEATGKYGYTNLERAKEFIGSLGWAVVAASGGWLRVCEQLNPSNLGTMRAQWTKLALSIRQTGGVVPELPALEAPRTDKPLLSFNEVMNTALSRKEKHE